MDKQLSELYYNAESGFANADKLYKQARAIGLNVTKSQVVAWLAKQESRQILKKKPLKKKDFITIRAERVRQFYQLDIMVYNRFAYHKYQYVICMVDIFSRYACARALTNKRMETLIDAVRSMFEEMGKPEILQADNEFNKKEFIKFAHDHEVEVSFFQPHEERKNAIVERFHETLAGLINKYRVATGDYDWPKLLPKILKNYNNNIHRITKETPKDIFEGKKTNKQSYNRPETKIKIGDHVRVPLQKKVFQKGDRPLFSKAIYTVGEKIGNKLRLKNSDGKYIKRRFNKHEVLKITEVQSLEKKQGDVKEHKQVQKNRKINTKLKQAGVEEKNVREGKRKRDVKVFVDPETGVAYALD